MNVAKKIVAPTKSIFTATLQRIFTVGRIQLKCDETERTKGTKLKLIDHWRIWMKNSEIRLIDDLYSM